ncbi:MAG TPA: hypothetical protein VGN63_04135 [Flavisolibacter sp.]|jgi:hypothetical protein|nr:hypothetical protein [Flavisolibacter sp.]
MVKSPRRKQMPANAKSFVTGLLLVLLASTVFAQSQNDTLPVLWEKKYDYRDFVLQVHACRNADILVFSLADRSAINIKRLRPGGVVVWDSTYQAFENGGVNNHNAVIKEDQKGAFTFTLNTINHSPFLGKIDSNGKLLFARQLTAASSKKQHLFIQSFFLQDTLLTCYGVKNGYFWMATFSDSALIRSEELYELEKNSIITDIVINKSGELLVMAKKGVFDKYGGGPSSLQVQKINAKERKLETVTSFDGKNGKMLQLPNGMYAVVFDASQGFPVQKFRYAVLDAELVLRINRPLFDNTPGSSPSFLHYIGSGSLAVFSVKNMRSTLLLVDFDGNIKGEWVLGKEKVTSLEHVFYNNKRIGYLCKYFVPNKAIDPGAMVKKKLALFSVER